MKLQKCICGGYPVKRIEGNMRYYECEQCGYEAQKSMLWERAAYNWEQNIADMINKEVKEKLQYRWEQSKVNLGVRVPQKDYDRIVEKVKQLGIPKSQFIVDAIEYFMSQSEQWTVEEYRARIYGVE